MSNEVAEELDSKAIIRQLLISTVLFLPLCFFIWFYASSLFVVPVKYLLQWIVTWWQPDLFNLVTQDHYFLKVETLIFLSQTFQGQNDKLVALDVTVNPMLYGYGLAVISGLVVSIPEMKTSKRVMQIIFGYVLIVLIQTFGSFWELIKHLIFDAGTDAQNAILATGLNHNFAALMYQLSYLIIPAVVPVAYWIIMNNKFISEITGLGKFGELT